MASKMAYPSLFITALSQINKFPDLGMVCILIITRQRIMKLKSQTKLTMINDLPDGYILFLLPFIPKYLITQ